MFLYLWWDTVGYVWQGWAVKKNEQTKKLQV
jgi:hypothetical protein